MHQFILEIVMVPKKDYGTLKINWILSEFCSGYFLFIYFLLSTNQIFWKLFISNDLSGFSEFFKWFVEHLLLALSLYPTISKAVDFLFNTLLWAVNHSSIKRHVNSQKTCTPSPKNCSWSCISTLFMIVSLKMKILQE